MNGYYITVRNKGYFILTDSKRKTKDIVKRMIARIAGEQGLCPDWTNRIINDKECIDRIRQGMTSAVYEYIDNHYRIHNKNMIVNFPSELKDKTYIVFS